MADPRRRAKLAQIHIARKDLGLDEETYRAMLREVAGVDSSADLTPTGLAKVLDHLRRLGWRPKPAKKAGRRPHTLDRVEQLRKIEAQLAELGAPWDYADAIARRMYGVDKVEWLRGADQFRAVIAALAVEQSKVALWRSWSDLQRRAGLTAEQADALAQEIAPWCKGDWRRNRRVLGLLIEHVGNHLATDGIDDGGDHARE